MSIKINNNNQHPIAEAGEDIKKNGSIQTNSSMEFSTVEIRGGCKSYGRGKNKMTVLDHLDMTVPQGAIYGLLGPSGCGKTTLLGTMVNTLKLDSGTISICGHKPGSVEAAVPGHRVGYMPQELALYMDFTIGETFLYFGRIHDLTKDKIKERTEFLIKFLDLPEAKRMISQLSGGQQRRVSFAVALLHEPELLILDEPTVGVDPLLRTSIWEHLVRVSKDTKATIIITTHYIEEARLATRVGLMRKGRLLAEASPANLMSYFDIPSLEDVFLKLCLKDGDLEPAVGKDNKAYKSTEADMELQNIPLPSDSSSHNLELKKDSGNQHLLLTEKTPLTHLDNPWTHTSKNETYFAFNRFKALLGKNVANLSRNLPFLLMSFLLPPIQTTLFCLTVGGTPQDLRMAVANLDQGTNIGLSQHVDLSQKYLESLNDDVINQVQYDSYQDGYDSVKDGKNWGVLYFEPNYTNAILGKLPGPGVEYPPDTGRIRVAMDTTNQQIYYTLLLQLYKPFQNLLMNNFTSVTNESLLTLPLLVRRKT